MEFSKDYWSGLPFPSPGDLPNPGMELRSPALQVDSLPAELSGKPAGKSLLVQEDLFKNRNISCSFPITLIDYLCFPQIRLKVLYYNNPKLFTIDMNFYSDLPLIFSLWQNHHCIYYTLKHCRCNQIMYILCKSKVSSNNKDFFIKIYQKCVSFSLMLTHLLAMIHTSGEMQPLSAAAAKSLQSCLTLCDPRYGSPPGFPVPGILQARILKWVAVPFSRESSQIRD